MDIITTPDVGAMVIMYLADAELIQLANVNKKMNEYFNSIGIWEYLWWILIKQPHPPCDTKTLRKAWMMNRLIIRSKAFSVFFDPINYETFLQFGNQHIDFLYHYFSKIELIAEYQIDRYNLNLDNTLPVVMHLLPPSKRLKIIMNTKLRVWVRLMDGWMIVNYKVERGNCSDNEILEAIDEANKRRRHYTENYLESTLLSRTKNFSSPRQLSMRARERYLAIVLDKGWTGRAWMLQNYVDMSKNALQVIWEKRPEELINYMKTPLTTRDIARRCGLCKKLNRSKELHYILLLELINMSESVQSEHKIAWGVKFLCSFVELNVITDVHYYCSATSKRISLISNRYKRYR